MILRRFLPSLRTITTKQTKLKKLKQYRMQKYSDKSFDGSEVLSLFQLSEQKQEKKVIMKYPVTQALELVKASPRKIVHLNQEKKGRDVVNVELKLNCDPLRSDQGVRGSCQMPSGLGKEIRIAVFTSDDLKQVALDAGADMIGDEDLIKLIMTGEPIPFQRCVATKDVMHELRSVARILGQKGLMPNKKVGTLVAEQNLAEAVKGFKAGSVEFRLDKHSRIFSKLGLRDFSAQKLLINFDALMRKLWQLKPESVKGRYINEVRIKSTFSEQYRLKVEELDPSKSENYFFA